ncbi:MAG: ribosome silencing factor [Saprospiraceae bacterium]|nr:ribosome silencing factor [Saprospiraceae bacterium]
MSAQVSLKKDLSTDSLNEIIIDSIQDIKGKNIVKLDMRELHDAPADYFIICEGESSTQVKAISERIHMRVKEETGTLPTHVEGKGHASWICVDYFTTVVHVFYKEKREFYELEDLWSDAKFTEYDNL